MAVSTTVVGMMWPTIDPEIGKWVLVACAAVFVIASAVFLWPIKETASPSGALSQSTAGTAAHNFNNVQTVNIHPPPPPIQERKQAYVRDPLESPRPRKGPPPDMLLGEVVFRVQAKGIADEKIDEFIMNGVWHYDLHTFAKIGGSPVYKPIPTEAWERGRLRHEKSVLFYQHPDQPGHTRAYKEVMFNRTEVDKWLPPDLGPHAWMAR